MPKFRQIFRLKCLCLLLCMAGCSPPEDPIKCASKNTNCTITNSYGAFPDRSGCRASAVAYPTTEEELISVVAKAAMDRTKMKAVTRFSHSIPKLVCTDGEDGLLISTKYLNRTLNIDPSAMTISIESGATLRQVIDEAAKAGLALPYAPYWWGLTIGGLLSSGAHGSSLWSKGSSVHEYVEQLRIITPAGRENGYVQVRTLDTSHEDLNAAKVSIGVLGVISQVWSGFWLGVWRISIDFLHYWSCTPCSDSYKSAVKFSIIHEHWDPWSVLNIHSGVWLWVGDYNLLAPHVGV